MQISACQRIDKQKGAGEKMRRDKRITSFSLLAEKCSSTKNKPPEMNSHERRDKRY